VNEVLGGRAVAAHELLSPHHELGTRIRKGRRDLVGPPTCSARP
jgi:hypothetical protein